MFRISNLFKRKQRTFIKVFQAISQELPDDLAEKLVEKSMYWAPEIVWEGLTGFVNKNIPKSASDPMSVKVYSILCNKKEDEMIALFIADGYK